MSFLFKYYPPFEAHLCNYLRKSRGMKLNISCEIQMENLLAPDAKKELLFLSPISYSCVWTEKGRMQTFE